MATADPHALFRHAEGFRAASQRLLPERGAPREHLAPYIATSVFALELYLKCLLMVVKGKYPQVHSVLALFYDLPEDEISRIRKLHRQIHRAHFPAETAEPARASRSDSGTSERDATDPADARLDAILHGAKGAFTVVRYGYERTGADERGIPDVSVVTEAVRGHLLALRPEWRDD